MLQDPTTSRSTTNPPRVQSLPEIVDKVREHILILPDLTARAINSAYAFRLPDISPETLYTGLVRPFDFYIIKKVAELIAQSPDKPIRILELAAGTTYTDNPCDYGCPFLSRALAAAFGKSVDITVSDVDGGPRYGSPVVFAHLTDQRQTGWCILTDFEERQDRFPYNKCERVEWLEFYIANRVWRGPFEVSRRPQLDPRVEAQFGLRTNPNLGIYSLNAFRPDAPFDLIFLRHGSPEMHEISVPTLSPHLTESGHYFIEIDNGAQPQSSFWDPSQFRLAIEFYKEMREEIRKRLEKKDPELSHNVYRGLHVDYFEPRT